MPILILLLTVILILVCFKNLKLRNEKNALEEEFRTMSEDISNHKDRYLKEFEYIKNTQEKLETLSRQMEYVIEGVRKEPDSLTSEIKAYTKLVIGDQVNFHNQKYLQN